MKLLYTLVAIMFVGLFLIAFSSYKALVTAQQIQDQQGKLQKPAEPIAAQPEVMSYVGMSYLGIALFVIGGAGGLFLAFRLMTHRF